MSVPLARRNTFHEKGMFILSTTGVAAAVAMIMLMIGLRAGLYAVLTAYIDNLNADLVVAQSGVQGMFSSDSSVALDIHDELASLVDAEEAGHILVVDVIFTHGGAKTPVIVVGYDPAGGFGEPWKLGEGRMLAADDEITLDTWLASRSGIRVDDEVELLGKTFEVVGLTRGTSSWMSPYVFITLDAAESALGLSGVVSYHLLRLPTGSDLAAAQSRIDQAFDGVEALTPGQIAEADRRVLATVMETPILVLLVIGVVIGAAVMGLTSYTAVSDRMREYGVLLAVGASRRQLAWLVVQETLYQTLFGFALAVGLSYLSAAAIMSLWPQFNILIEVRSVAQAGSLALVMTVLAALLPIRRLNQIDPLIVFKS